MDALNDDNEKSKLVSSNSRDETNRSRSESTLSDRTLLNMSDSEVDEKRRSGDPEKEGLVEQLPQVVTKEHASRDPYARAKILMWMFVNTLATVTIVSYHFPLALGHVHWYYFIKFPRNNKRYIPTSILIDLISSSSSSSIGLL